MTATALEVSPVHLHGHGHGGTRKNINTLSSSSSSSCSDAVSSTGSGNSNSNSNSSGSISRRRKLHLQQRDMWSKVESNFVPDDVKQIMILPDSDVAEHQHDAEHDAAAAEPIIEFDGTPRSREFCDACGFSVSITDEGFTACSNPKCSIIYKDVLDHSAEWRFYNADGGQMSDPTRCGMPVNPLLAESSYGCRVLCDGPSSYEMRKIRRYSEWQAMPYREKARYDEFQRITTVAHNNDIPKIITDEALRHHKRVSEHKTFRGLNRDGVIAASVYVACRIHNCPRTAKEIASIFSLDITSATRGCKNALVIINEIESDMTNSDKTTFCKTTPNSFIERYCSKLSMNAELTQLCLFVASRIEKNQLIPENTPHSIAAGIVYFIAQTCALNISKRDVNRVSEISEVTINKCFKKLDAHLETLIPKSVISKYRATLP
jgi:transcription initiation factor TFIIB